MDRYEDIAFVLNENGIELTYDEISEVEYIVFKEFDFSEYNDFILEKAREIKERNDEDRKNIKLEMCDLLTKELDSIVAELYGRLEYTPVEIGNIIDAVFEVLTDILNEHKGEK